MACNSFCGNGNNSCVWTLIIIAIVFLWLTNFGGTGIAYGLNGGCGCGCGCGNNGCDC